MKIKNNIIYAVGWINLCLLLIFTYYFTRVYNDAKDFMTDGARKDVQLMEVYRYRGEQVNNLFLIYFVMTFISLFVILFIYMSLKNKNKQEKWLINLTVIINVAILVSSLFTIMWMPLILIFLFSILLNYIVYIFSNKKIEYIDGEILFESDICSSGEEAESLSIKYLEEVGNLKLKKNLVIETELLNVDGGFMSVVKVQKN